MNKSTHKSSSGLIMEGVKTQMNTFRWQFLQPQVTDGTSHTGDVCHRQKYFKWVQGVCSVNLVWLVSLLTEVNCASCISKRHHVKRWNVVLEILQWNWFTNLATFRAELISNVSNVKMKDALCISRLTTEQISIYERSKLLGSLN